MFPNMDMQIEGWCLPDIEGILCGTVICCVVAACVFTSLNYGKSDFAMICLHLLTFLHLPKTVYTETTFWSMFEYFLGHLQGFEPQTKRGNQPSKTNNLIYPKSSLNQPYILYPPQINSQSVKAKLGQNELELNPKHRGTNP